MKVEMLVDECGHEEVAVVIALLRVCRGEVTSRFSICLACIDVTLTSIQNHMGLRGLFESDA